MLSLPPQVTGALILGCLTWRLKIPHSWNTNTQSFPKVPEVCRAHAVCIWVKIIKKSNHHQQMIPAWNKNLVWSAFDDLCHDFCRSSSRTIPEFIFPCWWNIHILSKNGATAVPESARECGRLQGLPTAVGICSQGKCRRCYLLKNPSHLPCVRKLHGVFVMFKIGGGTQARVTFTCFGKKVTMVELNAVWWWWVYLLLKERQGERKKPWSNERVSGGSLETLV